MYGGVYLLILQLARSEIVHQGLDEVDVYGKCLLDGLVFEVEWHSTQRKRSTHHLQEVVELVELHLKGFIAGIIHLEVEFGFAAIHHQERTEEHTINELYHQFAVRLRILHQPVLQVITILLHDVLAQLVGIFYC